MEKLIAMFNDDDGTFATIILVKGYDSDEKFRRFLADAHFKWNASCDEFYSVLQKRAAKAGYEISFPDFSHFYA